MRRLLQLVALAALATGCAPMPTLCYRGVMLGHPTMTVEDLSVGTEGRVRALSEGATGGLGGRTVATAK